MSDLAPFVAAVLRDRVLTEMKQENDKLLAQPENSRAVQIMSASGTVYAEGRFQDGFYGEPSLWAVILTKVVSCPLSDLENVQICVGGICMADLRANSNVRGNYMGLQSESSAGMDGCYQGISFRIAGTGFLYVGVGSFPSKEALYSQRLLNAQRLLNRDIPGEDMASFLSQELAVNLPDLSVNFDKYLFLR
jgi:hypothetical protein